MSYDLSLVNPTTHEVLQHARGHSLRGGTYALGGTNALELNVTYNYSEHFYRVLGPEGIRTIYGMTGLESLPLLAAAAAALGSDRDEDYWKPTEGNAQKALLDLAQLALWGLEGEWKGD